MYRNVASFLGGDWDNHSLLCWLHLRFDNGILDVHLVGPWLRFHSFSISYWRLWSERFVWCTARTWNLSWNLTTSRIFVERHVSRVTWTDIGAWKSFRIETVCFSIRHYHTKWYTMIVWIEKGKINRKPTSRHHASTNTVFMETYESVEQRAGSRDRTIWLFFQKAYVLMKFVLNHLFVGEVNDGV